MRARNGINADLIELGSTYAASKRPRKVAASWRRPAQSSRPCANGIAITSATCGIARYTGATHGNAATASRSPRSASRASSGSLITASPIHCGAMTRDRVMSRPPPGRPNAGGAPSGGSAAAQPQAWGLTSMGVRNHFAGLQAIHGPAVRALALARRRHVDEHARMTAPQRHLRVGAEHHARTLQVLRAHLDHGFRLLHRAHTFVSHSAYFGLRPLTMSKNAFWIFSVTGPREPLPSSMRSISRMGVTSAAVPVKNASSAMYTSSRVMRFSTSFRP